MKHEWGIHDTTMVTQRHASACTQATMVQKQAVNSLTINFILLFTLPGTGVLQSLIVGCSNNVHVMRGV